MLEIKSVEMVTKTVIHIHIYILLGHIFVQNIAIMKNENSSSEVEDFSNASDVYKKQLKLRNVLITTGLVP